MARIFATHEWLGVYEYAKIDTNDLPVERPRIQTGLASRAAPLRPGRAGKRVRIIKKIRLAGGVWKFISLDRVGSRYAWDKRAGHYFLEWWEGRDRRRQLAGQTPSQALEAQRRKRNELIGELVSGGKQIRPAVEKGEPTRIADGIELFANHIKVHSPAKPRTLERYREVLAHFQRILGKKKYVEAVGRSDIDDYKIERSCEVVGDERRPVSPATINFEVNVLRTFFYYLIRERGLAIENPCARFKPLRAEKERLKRRPPTYSRAELGRLFAACDQEERAMFATLLLTGLRKEELAHLGWDDLDLKKAVVRVRAKDNFVPKDYEERENPIPPDLVEILRKLPRTPAWVFASRNGKRLGRKRDAPTIEECRPARGCEACNPSQIPAYLRDAPFGGRRRHRHSPASPGSLQPRHNPQIPESRPRAKTKSSESSDPA
jgi:integrase